MLKKIRVQQGQWLGIVCLIGALLQFSNVEAQVAVNFNPSNLTLEAGERAYVTVEVTGISSPGLAAFQFDLVFDSGPIDLLNPNEAFRDTVNPFAPLGENPLLCITVRGTGVCEDPPWFLTSTGRIPVGTDRIDNVTGRIEVVYGTTGVEPLPTGDGAIALVEVLAVAGGTVVVDLAEVILADNSEPPTAYAVIPGSLTVTVANRAPALDPIGNQAGEAGIPFSVPLSSSDPDSDGLIFSVPDAPPFCVLVDYGDGTGSLDCSPAYSDVGTFLATVVVTDDGTPNLAAQQTFDIDLATAFTCTDADSDGYGSPGHFSCPAGDLEDCDDSDSSINPAGSEICRNTVDDDCNGLTDAEEAICASPTCAIIGLGAPGSDPTLTFGDPAVCPVGGILERQVDAIRGNLADVLLFGGEIRLGSATPIACASMVEGLLFDPQKPASGICDYYLARETGRVDYGASSSGELRFTDSGGCP